MDHPTKKKIKCVICQDIDVSDLMFCKDIIDFEKNIDVILEFLKNIDEILPRENFRSSHEVHPLGVFWSKVVSILKMVMLYRSTVLPYPLSTRDICKYAPHGNDDHKRQIFKILSSTLAKQLRLYKPPSTNDEHDDNRVVSEVGILESATPVVVDGEAPNDGGPGTAPLVDPTVKFRPNKGTPVSQLEYSRAIGCLMYAMISTRPDIAFVVGKISRYTSNPSALHWQALGRVFQYLKGTVDYGLTYSGYPSVIEGYSDASWINNMEDHSSTSGWVFLLGGGWNDSCVAEEFDFMKCLWWP
ncbi:hypothetical protein Tco_1025064 [Tanacetum coccineum]